VTNCKSPPFLLSAEFSCIALRPVTSDVLLVTSGNNTLVPSTVLMHGCRARNPAPEWSFGGVAELLSWAGGHPAATRVGYARAVHNIGCWQSI
jgi:hypothetical protein